MANERIMPEIDKDACTLSGDCVPVCTQGALSISSERKLVVDEHNCAYCGDCEDVCPWGAISLPYEIVLSRGDEEG